MVKKQANQEIGHFARAKTTNLSISTKHSVEISRFLRYKTTSFAKDYLQSVADLKKAVPFKKFNRDIGHKVGGMAAGRYPQKAAKEFLKLVNSVESNAQDKGLNTSSLKISKLIANKASIPMTGGRHRSGTKRTHLEIEVVEASKIKSKKIVSKETKTEIKPQSKVEEKKEEVKIEPKVEQSAIKEKSKVEKKEVETKKEIPVVEEKKEEVKVEPKPKVEEKQPGVKEEPKVEEKEIETKKETFVVEEKKEEVKKAKQSVKELSSEELLEKAQKVAAELNKKEKQNEDVDEVSNLYGQLQKKGTLRDGEKQ